MRFSTPLKAKELKAELKNAGVKVLRCKQFNSNALVTIVNTPENKHAFEMFAKENNYAGPCDLELIAGSTNDKYIDYGNVFKYSNAKTI